MKAQDIGIILVVFWLLFLHGCEQVGTYLSTNNIAAVVKSVPTVVAGPAGRLPLPSPPSVRRVPIVPVGMPELPTATPVQGTGPTPTAAPIAGAAAAVQEPTVDTSFWSPEDLAAFTATAEAFYNPAAIPTPPPEFVEYVTNACSTAKVKSPLCP